LQTNAYIAACEQTQKAVVIDPGFEADRIAQTIDSLNLDLIQILLTHGHFDHMAAAAELMKTSGAPLALHADDQELLRSGGGAALFGLARPPSPDHVLALAEGQEIPVGQVLLRVLHTPGHTPGHVSFYAPQAKAVFDGDVLFAGGIGRTDLPGGSHNSLMHSINQVLFQLPDDTTVYPGHGPATTIGQERTGNPWL
jgi:glyoxylase-like metal-dependent hydrolase (beta-lactamase superfamily II)